MSFISSIKVEEAHFVDENHYEIEILYTGEDKKTRTYYINKDHSEFIDLERQGFTVEKIEDDTAEWKKAQSRAYSELVNTLAKEKVERSMSIANELANSKIAEEYKKLDAEKMELEEKKFQRFLDATFRINESADAFFRFKLAMFNLDLFKKDATQEQKKLLRRSKTVAECFSILHEVEKQIEKK